MSNEILNGLEGLIAEECIAKRWKDQSSAARRPGILRIQNRKKSRRSRAKTVTVNRILISPPKRVRSDGDGTPAKCKSKELEHVWI